jgi:hypothetical protein
LNLLGMHRFYQPSPTKPNNHLAGLIILWSLVQVQHALPVAARLGGYKNRSARSGDRVHVAAM